MRTDTTTEPIIEDVTKSEVLEIASWDRPRTNEELQSFLSRHIESLDNLTIEGLELA